MRKAGYKEENTIISGSDHMLNEEQSKEGSGPYWKLFQMVALGQLSCRRTGEQRYRKGEIMQISISRAFQTENRTCKVPEVVTSMESVCEASVAGAEGGMKKDKRSQASSGNPGHLDPLGNGWAQWKANEWFWEPKDYFQTYFFFYHLVVLPAFAPPS